MTLWKHLAQWWREEIAAPCPEESAGDSLMNIVDEAFAQEMPGELSKPMDHFSVTGKPRHTPWHIRRKELEAGARTKRKKIESFQEIA